MENVIIYPHNPNLSDHFLVTYKFTIIDYTDSGHKLYYSLCLSDNTISKFIEFIPLTLSLQSCVSTIQNTYQNFTPKPVYNFFNSKAARLQKTLDAVTPLKKKKVKQRRLSPWFNFQISVLKTDITEAGEEVAFHQPK